MSSDAEDDPRGYAPFFENSEEDDEEEDDDDDDDMVCECKLGNNHLKNGCNRSTYFT